MTDSCVVYKNVEAVELRDGGGDGIGSGDVEVQRFGGADRAGQSFSGSVIDVGNPDECTGANEFLHGGFADAAGAAGDEGVPAIEAKRFGCGSCKSG